jgi:photosystem II stability/assembly factor-like uncharacterized protein
MIHSIKYLFAATALLSFLSALNIVYAQTNYWQEVNGLYSVSVQTFALNSSNHDLFAGTWGGGVFHSTDNGYNWLATGSSSNVQWTHSLVINSSGHIFAGTLGGAFRSTNNGSSWTQISTGSLQGKRFLTLAIKQNGYLFASVLTVSPETNVGVFRSTDNGATWLQVNDSTLTSGEVICFLIISDTTLLAGTYSHGLYRSNDNGGSWAKIGNGLNTGRILSLANSSTGYLFAGTDNYVFRSSDNGANWSAEGVSQLGREVNQLVSNLNAHLFAGTIGSAYTDYGLFRSTNNGLNWFREESGLVSSSINAIAFNYTGHALVGDGTNTHLSSKSTTSPVIITSSATQISQSAALMNGTIYSGANSGTYHFEYGATMSYDTHTATQAIDSNNSTQSVNALLDSLNSQTAYHYRLVASNSIGTTLGNDIEFITLLNPPAIPLLVSPAMDTIDQPTTLVLTWRAAFGATNYHLQLSTDSNFVTGIVINDSTLLDTTRIVSSLSNNIRHYWRVRAKNSGGTSDWSERWEFSTVITNVDDGSALPKIFDLKQNYPNPFNPSTTITYSLAHTVHVHLKLYSLAGEQIKILVDELQTVGEHKIALRNINLASGVYLYRLQAGPFVATKKLLLLR